MTRPYPIYLKLRDRPVVMIGGGRVAERRLRRLLDSDARLTVVSPAARPKIEALAREGRLHWEKRCFRPGDLDGVALAFLATGDRRVVEEVTREARKRGTLLNTAEDERPSDFHVPATTAVGDVEVAVSTGGASPRLAAALRSRLSLWLARIDAGSLKEVRDRRDVLRSDVLRKRCTTSDREALRELEGGLLLSLAPSKHTARRPIVYLVGAGPGDPGLLTVRARTLLERADVVFYDRLISREILATIPETVEKVYVGKEIGCARRANISELMIEAAEAGRVVVRLKGGDPVLFGRGGEELYDLERAGVECEVVPGVSALCAVPGSAGIPVTYRGIASELIIRSGHRMAARDGSGRPRRDRGETTFIYFMAVSRLPQVVEELRAEGLGSETPVAIVEKGTLPDQKVVVGELGDIVAQTRRETIEPPALIVVGNVVKFRSPREFTALLEGLEHERERATLTGAAPTSAGPSNSGSEEVH
ncbi:MAG: uroporphyrinogen-III C-methyltransferase [Planctomycetota bacterium]|nr:uroporphyrinogen-III C-methyltransferase [Planctomycetota bacterium]